MIALAREDVAAEPAAEEGVEALREQLNACQAELHTYKTGLRQAVEVCREAAKGNLEPRIIHIKEVGELGELLRSVNHLLDLTDAFVREAGASLQCASEEKFYRRILPHGMVGCFRSSTN